MCLPVPRPIRSSASKSGSASSVPVAGHGQMGSCDTGGGGGGAGPGQCSRRGLGRPSKPPGLPELCCCWPGGGISYRVEEGLETLINKQTRCKCRRPGGTFQAQIQVQATYQYYQYLILGARNPNSILILPVPMRTVALSPPGSWEPRGPAPPDRVGTGRPCRLRLGTGLGPRPSLCKVFAAIMPQSSNSDALQSSPAPHPHAAYSSPPGRTTTDRHRTHLGLKARWI